MLLPQSYLTATTDIGQTSAEDTTNNETTADTTDAVATDLATEGTEDGAAVGQITTEDGTNLDLSGFEVDENGNVTLSDEQLQALMGTQSQLPVQKEITNGISILYVIYGIFCIGLIILILAQNKRSAAFGNGMGGGNGDTYWAQNKGRSKEGQIDKITKVGIGIFIIATFVITLL